MSSRDEMVAETTPEFTVRVAWAGKSEQMLHWNVRLLARPENKSLKLQNWLQAKHRSLSLSFWSLCRVKIVFGRESTRGMSRSSATDSSVSQIAPRSQLSPDCGPQNRRTGSQRGERVFWDRVRPGRNQANIARVEASSRMSSQLCIHFGPKAR